MSLSPRGPGESEVGILAMVAANGVIGDGADQPWHLREDQRRFRSLTLGHPVIMGRRTFAAIGSPLPRRDNIVLTRNRGFRAEGVHTAYDLTSALNVARSLPGGDLVWIIGGSAVYADALAFADRLELTEVDADAPGSVRFPEIDDADWVETARDDRAALAFVTYRRRH